MAEEAQTDYRAAVQAKFPRITSSAITGTGPYALLLRCGSFPKVRLFESWKELQTAKGQECQSARCNKLDHGWVKLTAPAPAARKYIHPAHWKTDALENPA